MLKKTLLLGMSSMVLPYSAFAQEAESEEADDGANGLPTIIVTAQRRAEDLQDVPVAVTAFSGEQLAERQIESVVDIMTTVPNLHASNNIGQGSAVTAFIRGVGETESIPTIDTPVGFYLDDVYIARQGVNNLALFDVESIEVLRGPQGTLYGRNTSAGAIKVNTAKPDPSSPEFLFEGSYGRFDEWRLKGSANVPIGESAAIRINGIVGDGGGDTLNIFDGSRVNETSLVGGRAAVQFETGGPTIEIAGDYSRSNENGTYAIDISGISRATTGSLYIANSGTESRNIAQGYGITGRITWPLSDDVTLTSISAWRGAKQRYNWDLSDQPVPLYVISSTNSSDQFSQELQILGEAADGRLQFVAGLYYFREDADAFINDFVFQFLNFTKTLGVSTDSYAAFAQVDFDITDRLSVIVGGRLTRDEKSVEIEQRLGGTPGFDLTGDVIFDTSTVQGQIIPARPNDPVETDIGFSRFTPKIGLELRPTDDLLAYLTYTNGFKSGGWNARVFDAAEFFNTDPEFIDSYEVGLKATVADGRGTVNLAGFFYDYKNLFNTGTTATGFGIATTDAEIYGIELETAWNLGAGINMFANVSWQDAERKGVGATTIQLGEELQRLPEWQASVGIDVRQPISSSIDFIFNGSYSYTDEHFINPQNTPSALTGPINRVTASIGVGGVDKDWSLTLGCRNCVGDDWVDQILDFPTFGFITVYPGERGSWSLTARKRF